MEYKRCLSRNIFSNNSIILLGPRQIGKSTYLRNEFYDSLYIDLLDNRYYEDFVRNSSAFIEYLLAQLKLHPEYHERPIIIDEIQRIPLLLNDIQRLIVEQKLQFILCGSSARKILRSGSNLLGGRAIRVTMFPLVINELSDFNLLKYLNNGGVPNHYLSEDPAILLNSYVQNYIQEEVKNEGLVRNLNSFNRFLDLVGISNGEEINYSNISRDVGVDSKTIKEYFQILIDTLLGFYLFPYFDNKKRTNISQLPKFYLFDVGVANFLKGIKIMKIGGTEFGKSFEHMIYNELLAYKGYMSKLFDISYWRTYEKDEVDFVLGDAEVSIEVKGGNQFNNSELKSLLKFNEIYKPKKSIVVINSGLTRLLENGILVLPYREFVEELWNGKII